MAINRFYNPGQSKYVSQYAPVQYPWQLAYDAIKIKDEEEKKLRDQQYGVDIDPSELSIAVKDIGYGLSPGQDPNIKTAGLHGNQDIYNFNLSGNIGKLQSDFAQKKQALDDYLLNHSVKDNESIRLINDVKRSQASLQGAYDIAKKKREGISKLNEILEKDKSLNLSPHRAMAVYDEMNKLMENPKYVLPEGFSIGSHIDRVEMANSTASNLGHYSRDFSNYVDVSDGTLKVKEGSKTNDPRLQKAIASLQSNSELLSDIDQQAKNEARRLEQAYKAENPNATQEELIAVQQQAYMDSRKRSWNSIINQIEAKKVYEENRDVTYDDSYTRRKEEQVQSAVPIFEDESVSVLSEEGGEYMKKGQIDKLSSDDKNKLTENIQAKIESGTLSGKDLVVAQATLLNLNKEDYNKGADELLSEISNKYRDELTGEINPGNMDLIKQEFKDQLSDRFPELHGIIKSMDNDDINVIDNIYDRSKIDVRNNQFEGAGAGVSGGIFESFERKLSDDQFIESEYGVKDLRYSDNKFLGLIDNEEVFEYAEKFTKGVKSNAGLQFGENDVAYHNALNGTTSQVTVTLSDGTTRTFDATEEELSNYNMLKGKSYQDNIKRTFNVSGDKVITQTIDGKKVPQRLTIDDVALKNFISSRTGEDIDDDVTVSGMSATTQLSPDRADYVRSENIRRLEDGKSGLLNQIRQATNENQRIQLQKQYDNLEEALLYQEQPKLMTNASKIQNLNYKGAVPITNNDGEIMFNVSRDKGDVTSEENRVSKEVDMMYSEKPIPGKEYYGDRYVLTDINGNVMYETYAPEGITSVQTFKKIYKDFVGSNEFNQLSQEKQDQIAGQYSIMRSYEIVSELKSLGVDVSSGNYSYQTSGSDNERVKRLIAELSSLTTR